MRRPALRGAAGQPRHPVDPAVVLARAEVLDRRRTVLRVLAAVAVAVPVVAVGALLVAGSEVEFAPADGHDGGPVPPSIEASEPPPSRLADGTEAAEPPAVVTRRFSEPVVATERREALPASAGCTRSLLVGEGPVRDPTGVSDRVRSLIEVTAPVVTHVGPVLGTSLATAEAPAPPGYPDAYATTCTAQVIDGAWGSTGLDFTHLYNGWTGFATGGPDGVRWPRVAMISLASVPADAAWPCRSTPAGGCPTTSGARIGCSCTRPRSLLATPPTSASPASVWCSSMRTRSSLERSARTATPSPRPPHTSGRRPQRQSSGSAVSSRCGQQPRRSPSSPARSG